MKRLRLQCVRKITIRNRIIGGAEPLICLPLMASDADALYEQAAQTAALRPDLVEWRLDRFDAAQDVQAVRQHLAKLRRILAEIPLIFTCRAFKEGGFRRLDPAVRLEINHAALASGHVDLIDTEMSNGTQWIRELKDACRKAGVALILSYHNFDATPEEAFLVDRLVAAQQLGADIAKVAVMPAGFGDVLTLLRATFRARSEHLEIPMITISMEAHGALSRIVGGLFGSDITFAFGTIGSASGQVPIESLRKAWCALGIRPESTHGTV